MKMSEKDKKEFDVLYKYIKDIFGYDENQNLNKEIVLGLKGMKTGKAIENKKIKSTSNYPYHIIYMAFLLNRFKIDYVLRTKNFKNDIQAFCYIKKIAEKDIDYLYKQEKDNDRIKKYFDDSLKKEENKPLPKYESKERKHSKKVDKFWNA